MKYELRERAFQQMRVTVNVALVLETSVFSRFGWHHFLPHKQMFQAYAAKWLVFLFRLR